MNWIALMFGECESVAVLQHAVGLQGQERR